MRFPHFPFKPTPSPYNDLIVEATGAWPHEINIVEVIMREDIFHSTLDWQTAEEFAEGAREAYALYLSAKSYYRAEMQHRHFFFHQSKTEKKIQEAEQKVAKAIASGRPEKIAACQKKLDDLQRLHKDLTSVVIRFATEARSQLDYCFNREPSDLQPV